MDLREELNKEDPLRERPALPPEAVWTMRRRICAERPTGVYSTSAVWRAGVVMVTVLVAVAVAAAVWFRNPAGDDHRPATVAGVPPATVPGHTQVQFTTAGGTRIVWVLNTNLEL